jgi:hypothetical protein
VVVVVVVVVMMMMIRKNISIIMTTKRFRASHKLCSPSGHGSWRFVILTMLPEFVVYTQVH